MKAAPIEFVILGEPASKANSRKIVTIAGRPSSIKSDKAREYERNALKQIPPRYRIRYTGDVSVTLRIFYATERPDLDESVVLDVLQDRYETTKLSKTERDAGMKGERVLVQRGVYVNDRQVREKHVYHGIDKANPRTHVSILPLMPQQAELPICAETQTHGSASAVLDPLEV